MMIDEVYISTDFIEDSERNDFWREVTRPAYETLLIMDGRACLLEGSIRSRTVGSLLIGTTSFNRQRYIRDRRSIVQGGLDDYLLQVLTSGTLQGDFNGTNVLAGTGDICILDLSQTMKGQVEAGSTISVTIPRRSFEKTVGSRNLHGTVLKAQWPMASLIIEYLKGLLTLEDQLPDMQALAAQEAVVTLLSAALKGEQPDDVIDYSPLGASLRQRILEFISHNVHRSELSPDLIYHRFNVSRSHLYRAFAQDGGVAKVLREKRLDAAFQELTQTVHQPRSITEIAYNLGFSSGNQLLRAFRARFGMTPSVAKQAATVSLYAEQSGLDLQSYFARLSGRADEHQRMLDPA